MIERRSLPPFAPVDLQFDEPLQKSVCKGRFERIAHRYVDTAGLLRQRMKERQQQVFVGQYDGGLLVQRRLFTGGGTQGVENPTGLFALHGIRGGGDNCHLLLFTEVIVRHFDRRRKCRVIFAHEHSRLLIGILQIIVVVIPIKIGLGIVLQETEQHLLAGGESVEARDDIMPLLGEGEIARQQPVGCRTLHHPAVGKFQPLQPLAKAVINIPQRSPHRQKAAFLLRERRPVGKVGPELADHLQLFGSQVGDVGLQLLQFVDVAEQRIGVDTIFIDRIEVVEQHLAPEIELVERLFVIGRIDLVQLGDQADAFARMQPRNLLHQIVDRQPMRLPHRTFGQMRKGVDEKVAGTTGRKENVKRRNILSITPIEIGRDLLQKALHRPRFLLLIGVQPLEGAAQHGRGVRTFDGRISRITDQSARRGLHHHTVGGLHRHFGLVRRVDRDRHHLQLRSIDDSCRNYGIHITGFSSQGHIAAACNLNLKISYVERRFETCAARYFHIQQIGLQQSRIGRLRRRPSRNSGCCNVPSLAANRRI